jgi:hypothetical protein
MPLPPIESIQVATKATQHYLNRLAAARAGGPKVDFMLGLVRVGDGNGDIPPISDLLTAGDVLHEVATGSWVQAVTVNPNDPAQTDVLIVIPAVTGGEEIGPFYVTEFAITDENGAVCLVGNTFMAKFVSSQGASADIVFIASEKESNGVVELTPPSSAFATETWVRLIFNANLPISARPLFHTDVMQPSGFVRRTFDCYPAATPLDPLIGQDMDDADAVGYGRPATNLEFASGAPAAGGFQFPWVTIAQARSLIPVIPAIPGALTPLSRNDAQNRYEIALAGGDDVRSASATNKVVTPKSLADATAYQTLAANPTINWSAAGGFNARVTLSGVHTLALPTNFFLGETGALYVRKTSGAETLAFAAGLDFGANGPPVGSTAAGKWDVYSLQCVRAAAAEVTPIFFIALVGRGLTL